MAVAAVLGDFHAEKVHIRDLSFAEVLCIFKIQAPNVMHTIIAFVPSIISREFSLNQHIIMSRFDEFTNSFQVKKPFMRKREKASPDTLMLISDMITAHELGRKQGRQNVYQVFRPHLAIH